MNYVNYENEKILIPVCSNVELVNVVSNLAKVIFEEHYTKYIGDTHVKYMLESFQSSKAILNAINYGEIYYLINFKGENVGYFSFKNNVPKGKMFISKLYILKSARGNGLARLAFNAMISIAKESNFNEIWLKTYKHHQSVQVYQSLGMKVSKSIMNDHGNGYKMDDYIMSMEIV